MKPNPLVSVIVTTKNNQNVLEACLESIRKQTYKSIELIIVDNHSIDQTVTLAKKYTQFVFTLGPERSTQRNFGVQQATGKYVLIVDSDMVLQPTVIHECVTCMTNQPQTSAVIIPEESFGHGFWAQCKRLERSYYVGIDWIEAARFFPRKTFIELNGYNELMVSGEDWDLSQRMTTLGSIQRIKAFILHNEGELSLAQMFRKKFYYARHISAYKNSHATDSHAVLQFSLLKRLRLFFSKPEKILSHPLHWMGMMTLKFIELLAGLLGMWFPIETQKKEAPTAAAGENLFRWLKTINLDNTFLIGFYGGGNYGDELLLEVMQKILADKKCQNISIYYQRLAYFERFHSNYAYTLIPSRNYWLVLQAVLGHKHIVIGGGGLWGMDANLNVLFLGGLLLLARGLGKKVYLIGVGYYDSTNLFGRIGALLSGWASARIFVRDAESYRNFIKIQRNTFLDQDLALYIPEVFADLQTFVANRLPIPTKKLVIITLRRFKDKRGDRYATLIEKIVKQNSDKQFLLLLCEPNEVDPEGYNFIRRLAHQPNVHARDFEFNPLALVSYMERYAEKIAMIAPQYHMIISAMITKIRYLPIAYDNKVSQLYIQKGITHSTPLHQLTLPEIQDYIDSFGA